MAIFKLLAGLGLFASFANADTLIIGQGRPLPELDARFARTNHWIGADGDYSVALTPERTLWLFSDTWVGSMQDGKRVKATLVNNTIGVQTGSGTNSEVQFVVRQNEDGKPKAFITPADGKGWYWLQSGSYIDGKLFLFLMQVEKNGPGGAFGFRQSGQWLGVVTNPFAASTDWQIGQQKMPGVSFQPEQQVSFGAASLVDGNYLYIYGTADHKKDGKRVRQLVVARVPTNSVADFSTWRYFVDGQWVEDFNQAQGVADDMATECSVSYLPKFRQYALVYTYRGLSPKIEVRTSPQPWGKWSAATTVYECPEMLRDKNVFCYAAKAHPEQGNDNELIISYAANAYNFSQVMDDASLYWPRFISVPLTTGEK